MADQDAPAGADVDLRAWDALPARAVLYGEAHGRVVVSTDAPDQVLAAAARHGVPARAVGRVRPAADGLTLHLRGAVHATPLGALAAAYHDAIPALMRRPAAHAA
jgi:phosphoribosylformylglycinamidine synthase